MKAAAYIFALVAAHFGGFVGILVTAALMRSLLAPVSDSSLYSLALTPGPTGHVQRGVIAFARTLGALTAARLVLLAFHVDFSPSFVGVVVLMFTLVDAIGIVMKNDQLLYDRARIGLPVSFIAAVLAALPFMAW